MMRPAAYEVSCDAWDCDPERWSPRSQPIRIEGTRKQAIIEARRRGWRPNGKGWWCPFHSAAVRAARASVRTGS